MADLIGGIPLPNCPYADSTIPPRSSLPPINASSTGNWSLFPQDPYPFLLQNPAITVSFTIISTMCIVLSLTILVQFNQVRVFNRTIRDPSVRNTHWAAFFAANGVSYGFDAIRYFTNIARAGYEQRVQVQTTGGLSGEGTVAPETIDAWLLMSSAFLRGFAAFLLTLALEHQLVYRSPGKPKDPQRLFLSAHGFRQRPSVSNASAQRASERSSLPRGGPSRNSYGSLNRSLSINTAGGGQMIGAWPRTPSRSSFTSLGTPGQSQPPSATSSIGRRSSRNFDETAAAADPGSLDRVADIDDTSSPSSGPPSPTTPRVFFCPFCRSGSHANDAEDEEACCFCWFTLASASAIGSVVSSTQFLYGLLWLVELIAFYILM
ncbi:hypothetical protein HDU97_007205 [Phlyctochytrium planicorne]|nr:hypothetical protein HDU97_007205 [Phlyctochytrium planicorne]